jgi:circadian clock protein KaiB
MKNYGFKLYITGQTQHSDTAIENLRRICKACISVECDIRVIDVLDEPEQAELDHIIATPTLIKTEPLPARRVIGDLSDIEKVILLLGLPKA